MSFALASIQVRADPQTCRWRRPGDRGRAGAP